MGHPPARLDASPAWATVIAVAMARFMMTAYTLGLRELDFVMSFVRRPDCRMGAEGLPIKR
jgi:hypothetical protein